MKPLIHSRKVWERVVEKRVRINVSISENQFGFMPGWSTTEAIHLVRRLVEQYRERKKDLYMVFIDLERAYNKIPREMLLRCFEASGVPVAYIRVTKDMYEALDVLTRHIQGWVRWCMLFADDIVLIGETREGVNARLKAWRQSLKSKGFKLSRSKTEYLECKFSDERHEEEVEVKIYTQVIPKIDSFKYLGSIIQGNREIDEDVTHGIGLGWMRWRVVVILAMLYGVKCWPVKKSHVQKIKVAEIRMLRWMYGHTRKDKIRNVVIRDMVRVESMEDMFGESRMRLFGHVKRRDIVALVKRCERLTMAGLRKGTGRQKKYWGEVIRQDMSVLHLTKDMTSDRKLSDTSEVAASSASGDPRWFCRPPRTLASHYILHSVSFIWREHALPHPLISSPSPQQQLLRGTEGEAEVVLEAEAGAKLNP
ncbi:PREDICTED: uncharacterized protein LOC109239866 [Nicotiana attenuata]|uniref:uncharacterized protein LOC109239866 n=1 Tax=Nicotiana attenuata TaxID=49451 RepID=UPI000904D453|nr:PREDICTED: uncharacterized protein LOC109239866 [Nicotiana attenuata]